jgi:2-methylcitrate dehydratase PrpD
MTLTNDLIAFTNAQPNSNTRDVMQLSVLDWAACGLAGAAEGSFDGFVTANATLGSCQIIGGGTGSPTNAALINGTLSHSLDFDDTHFAHIGHPSVAVVSAALAISQHVDASVPVMIDAALIGAEASVHVGLWLGRDHYQIGYHQTATAGAFGATIAAARLLKLSDAQISAALGLTSTMASGLKSQFGTMGKPLNAGLAARCGVEAALWAQSGMTSADDGLEGPLGFGETHHGQHNTTNIGQGVWQMETVSHKFHACCHGLHAMLEALADVSVETETIQSAHVSTHPRWLTVCNIVQPRTGLECKFSYSQTAAMALSGINTGDIEQYNDGAAKNQSLTRLAQKVAVTGDETLSEMQSKVRIVTDVNEYTVTHDLAAPMPLSVRQEKLLKKANGLVGSAAVNALWAAVQGDDLKTFTTLLNGIRAH